MWPLTLSGFLKVRNVTVGTTRTIYVLGEGIIITFITARNKRTEAICRLLDDETVVAETSIIPDVLNTQCGLMHDHQHDAS